MKKNRVYDLLWLLFIVFVVAFMLTDFFKAFSKAHSYISSFIKFALLAPMGELLVIKMTEKNWRIPIGFIYKVLIWGVFGMAIGLAFKLFSLGTQSLIGTINMSSGVKTFLTALLTSTFMNTTFGPVMMGSHKITDKLVAMKCSDNNKVTLKKAVKAVDWYGFITFVVFKTVPFFWIPAHTIVFLLPSELRIIIAALLSIALGILLTIANKAKTAK